MTERRKIASKGWIEMAHRRKIALFAGAKLVCLRHRPIWLIYAANLVLGFLAAHERVAHSGEALDHSLAAARLVKGFDLGALLELAVQPERYFALPQASIFYNAALFAFLLLFFTGGVLETYRSEEKVPAGEFFRACAAFFWRLIRLVIVFLLLLIPFATLAGLVNSGADAIGDRSVSEQIPFWIGAALAAALLFLLLALRLWFDMAEVIAVAENETKTPRTLVAAARLTRQNFGRLFALFLSISLVAWAGLAFGIWAWIRHVRPEAIGAAFLVTQATLFFLIVMRLWQRASEMQWYIINRARQVSEVSAPGEAPPDPAEPTQPQDT
jgi:hypothetical protein